MARYERFKNPYTNQRLGAFDGPLGDLASAQAALTKAQQELAAAQQAFSLAQTEANQYVSCPPLGTQTRIACPGTAAAAQSKLATASSRLAAARDAVKAAQQAVSTEQTAATITGVGSILAPLAQAGAVFAQTHLQAQTQKELLKAQGQQQPSGIPMIVQQPNNTGTILAVVLGLAALGAVAYFATKK